MSPDGLAEPTQTLERLCGQLLRLRHITRESLIGVLIDLCAEYAGPIDPTSAREQLRAQLHGLAADHRLHRADLACILGYLAYRYSRGWEDWPVR